MTVDVQFRSGVGVGFRLGGSKVWMTVNVVGVAVDAATGPGVYGGVRVGGRAAVGAGVGVGVGVGEHKYFGWQMGTDLGGGTAVECAAAVLVASVVADDDPLAARDG